MGNMSPINNPMIIPGITPIDRGVLNIKENMIAISVAVKIDLRRPPLSARGIVDVPILAIKTFPPGLG